MGERMKKYLVFFLVAALLVTAVIIGKINSKLPENPMDYAGNTAGNIYNRGLFAEDENYIYFANLADNFRLYRTTHSLDEVTCLNKDSVEYINPDSSSEYIYYSRINYRKNTYGNTVFDILDTGIYRFGIKTEQLTRLYPDACGMVLLGGNSLFYQAHGDDGNFDLCSLSVNKKDAKSETVTTEYILPANYRNGLLYYAGVSTDRSLYSMSPDTGNDIRMENLDCFQPIVTDSGTYYLSLLHNYGLYYLPDNSDTPTLITGNRVSAYNISKDGRTLFYQIDNGINNRLCRCDTFSKKEEEILSGNYKNLNTVSHYLFFTDFEETTCYCYDISTGGLYSFMPLEED